MTTTDEQLLAEIDRLEEEIARRCTEKAIAPVGETNSEYLAGLYAQMEWARKCVCQDKLAIRDRLRRG